MADANPPTRRLSSTREKSERRKVRKGTQSCWECKRRKIKCTFLSRDVTCDNCKRRRTACVGQEFPDADVGSTRERLGRVEALVEQLMRNTESRGVHDGHTSTLPSQQRLGSSPYFGPRVVDVFPTGNFSILPPSDPMTLASPSKINHERAPLPSLTLPSAATTPVLNRQQDSRDDEICRALLAVWPNENNLRIILSIPVEMSWCLHGLICLPPSNDQGWKAPSPQDLLQPPSQGSHPVIVARKLLILGSYLQALPPSGLQSLSHLGVSCRDIMSRAVEAAYSLVNCNDRLVDSIEGIECIAIESMYHNNAGNLRRSWLTMRRAMLIAQTMDLHRSGNRPLTKTLEFHACVRPEHVWFRLVHLDRYLSLTLGLPPGTLENSFATAKALEACTATERLQRIHCVVAGRILQRNETDINNITATQEIDQLLRKASGYMPPQWWLTPNITSCGNDKTKAYQKISRMMDQLPHYHLVTRLHLPYLLQSSADRRYQYSTITAVNASREVLARFMALCSSNLIESYYRGIDLLVLFSSVTLCLAYINVHCQDQASTGDGIDGFSVNSLVHQRPSDRGMMERVLESVENMARDSADMVASTIASIIQHLLAIEADAANGGNYGISFVVGGGEDGLKLVSRVGDGGNVLRIYIPSVGTITIQRSGVSSSFSAIPPPPEDEAPTISVSEAYNTDPLITFGTSSAPEMGYNVRRSSSMLGFPVGHSTSDQCVNLGWQPEPRPFDSPVLTEISIPKIHDQCISSIRGGNVQVAQPVNSRLEIGAGDLTLDSANMELFDTFIQESGLDAV